MQDSPRLMRGGDIRARRIVFILAGIVAAMIVLPALAQPYALYRWFVEDLGHPEVFTLEYKVRGALFVLAFALSLAFLWLNLARVAATPLVYGVPENPAQAAMVKLIGGMNTGMRTLAKLASVIAAFMVASGVAGTWREYLMYRNGGSFGRTEALFGNDYGFYVFRLPWFQDVTGYVATLAIATLVLSAVGYLAPSLMAITKRGEFAVSRSARHLTLLLGLAAVALALRMWLGLYDLVSGDEGQFVGAGYATCSTVWMRQFGIGFLAAAGLIVIFAGGSRRVWRLAASLGVLWVVLMVLGGGVLPSMVQRFKVEPDKLNVEGPYASRAIEATRFAYGLDKFETENLAVASKPDAADVDFARVTLDNMRLWDPRILQQTINGVQSFKPYYDFFDVDIDRYMVDGQERVFMVSPRDINTRNLDPRSKGWVNEHLQYTHGYGVVVSPINATDPSGGPRLVAKDIPQATAPWLKISKPQVYYSDWPEDIESYALVDTGVPEFDYPSDQGSATTRWQGSGGIHVGGLFDRLLFSSVLQDGNLLISGNVKSTTRLLMHRSVRERADLLFPFLRFDGDPYCVVSQSHLVWILDGYTTSDAIPYSARFGSSNGSFNYLRNSVKVTVDAYDGTVHGYAVDPSDPLLQCWRRVYPGIVEDFSAMPQDLRRHLRYPDGILQTQATVLATYHVTNSTDFLTNNDAWQVPLERGLDGNTAQIRPYFLLVRLEGDAKAGFVQILPFAPSQKSNLVGWLAAKCDEPDYGRVVLYRFAKGTLIAGPEQMESFFSQDRVVADINRQYNNDQSQIVVGNMLVVPIGHSMLYVEPLFLKSRQGAQVPQLKKVVLGINGSDPVVADTYQQALDLLLGSGATPTAPAPTEPNQNPSATSSRRPMVTPAQADVTQMRSLLKLLDQADAALRQGDFAKYGELQKQLRSQLSALAGK